MNSEKLQPRTSPMALGKGGVFAFPEGIASHLGLLEAIGGTVVRLILKGKQVRYRSIAPAFAFTFSVLTSGVHAQVLERDPQGNFSVSRPIAWVKQDRPSPAIRVMLGIEGDGYVGNCNISVLPSPRTASMTQAQVDAFENKRVLGASFFQPQLLAVAPDVQVLSVFQLKRGAYFGHLVNYSYSYMSPSLQRRVHIRAELFSHSRPGKVFSFTCSTGSLSPSDAQSSFSAERRNFESLTASLRVDP